MVEGTIRSINHAERTAIIAMRDGREVQVHIPLNTHIEVTEPATLGMMGGTLADLGPGQLVHLDLNDDSNAVADLNQCTNLVCIS
jgi:hypothetical protein